MANVKESSPLIKDEKKDPAAEPPGFSVIHRIGPSYILTNQNNPRRKIAAEAETSS